MVDGGAHVNQPGGVINPLRQRLDNLTVSELRNMFLAYGRNNPLGRSAEEELNRRKIIIQRAIEKLGPKISRARTRLRQLHTNPNYQPDYNQVRHQRNMLAFIQGRKLPYTVEDTGRNYEEGRDGRRTGQRHPFVRNLEGELVTDTHNSYSQRPDRQQGLKKRVVDAWKRKV